MFAQVWWYTEVWRYTQVWRYTLGILILVWVQCLAVNAQNTPVYSFEIVNVYPHNTSSFTQGLIYDQGFLYESTGLFGQSRLMKVELETGKPLQTHELEAQYFGEGLTLYEGQLFQLTWLSNTGFVYDQSSFAEERRFTYQTEGWGITHDGETLIMSDGSDTLFFRDPVTFEIIRQIKVKDQNQAITRLNELEFIEGEIFANVWQTDFIARIDPGTGNILGWIDLSPIHENAEYNTENGVLNGIAYDPVDNRIFVTGKRWGHLFEIQIQEAPTSSVRTWSYYGTPDLRKP